MRKKDFIRRLCFLGMSVLVLSTGAELSANTLQQEAPPRGIYLGMSTGQLFFTNSRDRQLYGDSLLIGLKAGYDLFPFLTLEAQTRFSGHKTSQATSTPGGIPTSFLAFQGLGMARALYPLTRRVSLTAELGGGFWYSSPNQRPTTRGAYRAMATGGMGVQYFMRIRGLAMGLDPQLSVIQDLEGPAAQLMAYLRYTF
jgi:hypothetical protein